MSAKANEPQSAFPLISGPILSAGLTKRELFAAMALQSLIAKTARVTNKRPTDGEILLTDEQVEQQRKDNTRGAVDYADALLKALEAVPGGAE